VEFPVLRCFNGFIATSRFTAGYLAENGLDAKSIQVLEPAPMVLDTERNIMDGVHALLLGSLTPRKGQLAFLHALDKLNPPPSYSLTLAGSLTADPGYALQCRDIVRASGTLSRCVRIAGEQPAEVIRALYAQSNLFISAAEMETFGMAIQDAVVSGMPVLVKEGGYAGEHVSHGENGFRLQSHMALAEGFVRCITDPDHFRSLQTGAQDYRHVYQSWEDAASGFIDAFL
jgi:glycosyltransferase involved in cell wall biosynthesis